MVKKTLVVLLLILCLFWTVPAYGEEEDFEVSIQVSDTAYEPGDTVTVQVYLNAKENTTLYNLKGTFYYDPLCFDYISGTTPLEAAVNGPTSHNATLVKLYCQKFPWGDTFDVDANQLILSVQLRAKAPEGFTGGAGTFHADITLAETLGSDTVYVAEPLRWYITQNGSAPVSLTARFQNAAGEALEGEPIFLSGTNGYNPGSGFSDTLAWGDDVTFYLSLPEEYRECYDVKVTCAGETLAGVYQDVKPSATIQMETVYTLPASLLTEDREITVTLMPKVSRFHIATKESVVDGTPIYVPFSLFSGSKVLVLLDLPEETDWQLTDGTLMKLTDGIYDGYGYAALLDLSHIDPADSEGQLAYIKEKLIIGEAEEYIPSTDVNGFDGNIILDLQAAYDMATRTELFWTPGITEMLNADADRDGTVTLQDVILLMEAD